MENKVEKLPYPKSVFFIIANEFCERFSYYGMRVVLTLYLASYLQYDESVSTIIFHVFISLCYFLPLLGAIIADSFLGKYKTILYLSIVYAIGNIVLSLGSVEQLHLPQKLFTIFGLLLIATGTGGIKPCVSALGGDQFQLPAQAKQFASFFSIFYFSINAGSFLSTALTPILRELPCLNTTSCYPLAFGVPAVLMVISILIFVGGYSTYILKPPQENVILKVFLCIKYAIMKKGSSKKEGKKEHWLDHASDMYDHSFIQDIKGVLAVLLLYLPFPIFWSLYDQQGSTWTFQATRMDGWTPFFTIKPDQFQAINTILILVFIPLFDKVLYPKLEQYGILKKPLQRLTTGGILAAVAFLISALLELQLEKTYPALLTQDKSNLNFINKIPCTLNVRLDDALNSIPFTVTIPPNTNYIYEQVDALPESYVGNFEIVQNETSFRCKAFVDTYFHNTKLTHRLSVPAFSGKAKSFLINIDSTRPNELKIIESKAFDVLEKTKSGDCHLSVLSDIEFLGNNLMNSSVEFSSKDNSVPPYFLQLNKHTGNPIIVKPNKYTVTLVDNLAKNGSERSLNVGDIEVFSGGNYIVALSRNYSNINGSYGHDHPLSISIHAVTLPNSVHMLWLLPQYITITAAEILFSITGLEFSYKQAPQSMKSVVNAAWLLTSGFGNLIVVFSHTVHFFDRILYNLLLFAGLMIVDMIIFGIMAYYYVPKEKRQNNDNENQDDNNNRNMDARELNSSQDPPSSSNDPSHSNINVSSMNMGMSPIPQMQVEFNQQLSNVGQHTHPNEAFEYNEQEIY